MKTKFAFFILLSLLFSFNLIAQKGGKHKIVFQFTNANDTLQQKAFTNQLNNLRTHWPDAKIEVVCYNHGLEYMMIKKTKFAKELAELSNKGIDFVVCQNTMTRMKVVKEDLLPFARIVPAGIAEIVEKQEKKWSYIKGGF